MVMKDNSNNPIFPQNCLYQGHRKRKPNKLCDLPSLRKPGQNMSTKAGTGKLMKLERQSSVEYRRLETKTKKKDRGSGGGVPVLVCYLTE